MNINSFTNADTQMTAEVFYVAAHFRTDSDHRYKVILRDLDSDSVAGVVWFSTSDDAETFAHNLVFPSSRLISSPTFLPEFK